MKHSSSWKANYAPNSTAPATPRVLGGAVFLPRQLAHSFLITSPEARYLTLHTPTGFDAFTREAGIPDDGSGRPPQAPPPPQELRRIAARYNIEIIGPPPHL